MHKAMPNRLIHQTLASRDHQVQECVQHRLALEFVAMEMSEDELRQLAMRTPLVDREIDSTFLRIGDRPGYRRS